MAKPLCFFAKMANNQKHSTITTVNFIYVHAFVCTLQLRKRVAVR